MEELIQDHSVEYFTADEDEQEDVTSSSWTPENCHLSSSSSECPKRPSRDKNDEEIEILHEEWINCNQTLDEDYASFQQNFRRQKFKMLFAVVVINHLVIFHFICIILAQLELPTIVIAAVSFLSSLCALLVTILQYAKTSSIGPELVLIASFIVTSSILTCTISLTSLLHIVTSDAFSNPSVIYYFLILSSGLIIITLQLICIFKLYYFYKIRHLEISFDSPEVTNPSKAVSSCKVSRSEDNGLISIDVRQLQNLNDYCRLSNTISVIMKYLTISEISFTITVYFHGHDQYHLFSSVSFFYVWSAFSNFMIFLLTLTKPITSAVVVHGRSAIKWSTASSVVSILAKFITVCFAMSLVVFFKQQISEISNMEWFILTLAVSSYFMLLLCILQMYGQFMLCKLVKIVHSIMYI